MKKLNQPMIVKLVSFLLGQIGEDFVHSYNTFPTCSSFLLITNKTKIEQKKPEKEIRGYECKESLLII
jgi:hypothetical protein